MKKWNEPKIWSLGVESTKEDHVCDCGPTLFSNEKNIHFCHSDGLYHENGCKKVEGHNHNNSCTINDHGTVPEQWNGAHLSKCCCS